jgi:transcriptional regulator with XRE-family HTH domain
VPAQRPPTTLRLRRLAGLLLRLREESRLTRETVTERTGINAATLYRIETARARPQKRTLTALLELYAVPEPERSELYGLARQAAERSWLQSFPDELPTPYRSFIGFEGEAKSIASYESLFVPGLLQTADYARAASQATAATAPQDVIDLLAEARIGRQAVLARDPPLRLWAILDEGALHRLVGGPAVMSAQLGHLAGAARLPHVTVQVIPFGVGGHPGMAGSFAILRFSEPSGGDIVFLESQAADLFLESETDVERFATVFEQLRAVALSPAESVSLITRIARDQAALQEG